MTADRMDREERPLRSPRLDRDQRRPAGFPRLRRVAWICDRGRLPSRAIGIQLVAEGRAEGGDTRLVESRVVEVQARGLEAESGERLEVAESGLGFDQSERGWQVLEPCREETREHAPGDVPWLAHREHCRQVGVQARIQSGWDVDQRGEHIGRDQHTALGHQDVFALLESFQGLVRPETVGCRVVDQDSPGRDAVDVEDVRHVGRAHDHASLVNLSRHLMTRLEKVNFAAERQVLDDLALQGPQFRPLAVDVAEADLGRVGQAREHQPERGDADRPEPDEPDVLALDRASPHGERLADREHDGRGRRRVSGRDSRQVLPFDGRRQGAAVVGRRGQESCQRDGPRSELLGDSEGVNEDVEQVLPVLVELVVEPRDHHCADSSQRRLTDTGDQRHVAAKAVDHHLRRQSFVLQKRRREIAQGHGFHRCELPGRDERQEGAVLNAEMVG